MKVIAHRGASAEYPENTMAAFRRAAQIGVDAVETDLLATRDGRIVLRHDDWVIRDGRWQYVRELTFEELSAIDLGGGERIPALEEFLGEFLGRFPLFLDIKSAGVLEGLAGFLSAPGVLEKVHITSALQNEILEIGRRFPSAARSIVLAALPFSFENILREAGVREISLHRGTVSEPLVEKLGRLGIKVRAYPVNAPREAELFKSWGLEGIFTDDPAAMRRLKG